MSKSKPAQMKRVNKNQFYSTIKTLDVVVTAYPHETLFKLRHGNIVGRKEGYLSDNKFYELSVELKESSQ